VLRTLIWLPERDTPLPVRRTSSDMRAEANGNEYVDCLGKGGGRGSRIPWEEEKAVWGWSAGDLVATDGAG
jgi:hypothetical protein